MKYIRIYEHYELESQNEGIRTWIVGGLILLMSTGGIKANSKIVRDNVPNNYENVTIDDNEVDFFNAVMIGNLASKGSDENIEDCIDFIEDEDICDITDEQQEIIQNSADEITEANPDEISAWYETSKKKRKHKKNKAKRRKRKKRHSCGQAKKIRSKRKTGWTYN